MRHSHRITLALGVLLSLLYPACASRPDAQMQEAQAAMAQAEKLRAEEYAPADWKNAKEAWDEAQAQLARGSFSQAGTLFLTARSRFQKAGEISDKMRQSYEKEVGDLRSRIGARYEQLKSDVAGARLSAKTKKEIGESFQDIDKRLQVLDSQMEQGDFIQAKTTALDAMRKIVLTEEQLKKATGGR